MDKIFRAMADKNRRKVLTVLREVGEVSVLELLKNFDISQGTLSTHLAVLRKAGLVKCRVAGRCRIYGLEMEVLQSFIGELNRFGGVMVRPVTEDVVVRR